MSQQPPKQPQRPQYPQQPNAQPPWSYPSQYQQYGASFTPNNTSPLPPFHRQQSYGQSQWNQQSPSPYPQSQQTQYGPLPSRTYISPQQQFQQPQWSTQQIPRQTTNRLILAIVGILISVTVLVIYTSGQSNLNQSSSSSTIVPTPTPAKVGDTITIDGVGCTLISVPAANTDGPGLVFVTINLVNNSSSEYDYYTSDFHIIDNSGSIIDPQEAGSGALAPGGHVKESLIFLIDDPHNAQLLWQPVGYSNDLSHVWNLGL